MLKSMIRGIETVGHSPGKFRNERWSRRELQQNEIQATVSKHHKVPPVVFWTASITFLKKHVSWESEQRFKSWGKHISIQEKKAMPYQYSSYKEY